MEMYLKTLVGYFGDRYKVSDLNLNIYTGKMSKDKESIQVTIRVRPLSEKYFSGPS